MKNFSIFLIFLWAAACGADQKSTFWHARHKGANIFNKHIPDSTIDKAKEYNIGFVRIAPDRFPPQSPDPSKNKDFLLGDADNFQGLVPEDLQYLRDILDRFYKRGISIVLTMLSLPGSRWKQNNQDQDDLRLWQGEKYVQQAAQFWQELAVALKDHPAVVGYNPLNEPHPHRLYGESMEALSKEQKHEISQKLHNFNEAVVAAIRCRDKATAIILDGANYADPQSFALLTPVSDHATIYAFHMYEPYVWSNRAQNNGRYAYPGKIDGKQWDRVMLRQYLKPVADFQAKYDLPSWRILAEEFGGNRLSPGLTEYFSDLLAVFDEQNWSWAVYSFQEDVWDGMDYEMGTVPSWRMDPVVGSGMRDPDNPLFTILRQGWGVSS